MRKTPPAKLRTRSQLKLYTLLSVIAAIVLIGGALVYTQQTARKLVTANQVSGIKQTPETPSSQSPSMPTSANHTQQSSLSNRSAIELKLTSPKLQAAYNNWRTLRGYSIDKADDLMDGTPPDYFTYSDETLQKLLAQNDMYAAQALALKELHKAPEGQISKEPELLKAKAFYQQAAILGSTQALNQLQAIDTMLSISHKKANPELAHKYEINSRLWLGLQKLRGDLSSSDLSMRINPEKFTNTELKEIEQKAQIAYEFLAQQRRNKGLPEFDNSPSEIQQLMIDYMNQENQ